MPTRYIEANIFSHFSTLVSLTVVKVSVYPVTGVKSSTFSSYLNSPCDLERFIFLMSTFDGRFWWDPYRAETTGNVNMEMGFRPNVPASFRHVTLFISIHVINESLWIVAFSQPFLCSLLRGGNTLLSLRYVIFLKTLNRDSNSKQGAGYNSY